MAFVLAALVFASANLVHLPALHEALHDAHHHASGHGTTLPDHDEAHASTCVVALFTQGLDAPGAALFAPLPDRVPAATLRLLASATPRLAPPHRLPPSQAPPRASLA